MSQAFSTYSKLSNASAKLSTRRIFTKPNNTQGTDLFKISAKIRELEDDVKIICQENREIQQKNKQLIKILQSLEYVVNVQQVRLNELTQCLEKDIQANESIEQYENDLKIVADQINTLNQLIRSKNQQYEYLKSDKQKLIYENIKLKQQSNILLYNQNSFSQEVDELIDKQHQDSPTFNQDLQHKISIIFHKIEQLISQAHRIRSQTQQYKVDNQQKIRIQKQKRIKIQYQLKLIKQRKSDQQKKQNYFKGFYDESKIQAVIDDMLKKEDSLRRQIALQEQENLKITAQWEHQIQQFKNNSSKEVFQKEQEIKFLSLETQNLNRQHQAYVEQYSEITHKMQSIESQGLQLSQLQQKMDDGLWKRIRMTQQQNLFLEQQFEKLSAQVNDLQKYLLI